jgi:hypothetical protein
VNARNVRAALAVIGATVDSVEQVRPAPGWDTCAKVLFHKGTVSSMRDGWFPRELDGCPVGTCEHGGGAS